MGSNSGNTEIVYDNRLVRFILLLNPLRDAEFSSEDAFTHYHLIQEENGRAASKAGPGPSLPALGHALAGSIATASAKSLVYPVNLCVTRMQVQRQLRNKGEAENAARDADKEYNNIIDAARKIYKTEGGLKAFYAGCPGDISKGILDSFLFFGAYNALRELQLKRNGSKHLSVGTDLLVGVLAGSIAKFCSSPIENIVTRQQTAALTDARDPSSNESSDSTSPQAIARQIYDERGITGFWSGYSQSVILTINPALTFAVDNTLTRLLPQSQRNNPSPAVRFLVSALSKAIATTSVYPIMLAKSRSQVSGGLGSEEEEDGKPSLPHHVDEKADLDSTPRRRRVKSALQTILSLFKAQCALLVALRKVYRTEGLTGLYSGIEGEVIKGFLQHGLTMMVKDKVHVAVIQFYYLLLKATKRWPEEFSKQAGNVKEGMGKVAEEAKERVENVGETVVEGAKRVVGK